MGSAAKTPRAKFVERLHRVLACNHPDLRWVSNDRFEVAADDTRARRALAADLSSFVRQLSYYGFKRMSDRRRSVDKGSETCVHVIFGHPSGNFRRDDPESLHLISRRPRLRKSSKTHGQSRHRKTSVDDQSGESEDWPPRLYEQTSEAAHNLLQGTRRDAYQPQTLAGLAQVASLQRASWPGLRLPIQTAPCSWASPYPTPLQYSPDYRDNSYLTDSHTPPLDMVGRAEYFPPAPASDKQPMIGYVAPALLSPVSHVGLSSRRASACSMYSHASVSSGAPASPAALPPALPDFFSSFQTPPHPLVLTERRDVVPAHAPDAASYKPSYAPYILAPETSYQAPWAALPTAQHIGYARDLAPSHFPALEQPGYHHSFTS
ncbi:hypothetical protein OIV83_000953 [Microbotryomycetes sp. JL201]|nr:hypothetical protein OIV83_000953 [Microbotryomycetes sp. JL201]